MCLGGTHATVAAKLTICRAVKAMARATSRLYLEAIRKEIEAGRELLGEGLAFAEKALRMLEEVEVR